MITIAIGKRIENLAKEQGLTLSELSKQANVSYNTIYAIVKRDNQKVDHEILSKIAGVLKVVPYELMDFTEQYSIPKPKDAKYVFDSEEHRLQMDVNHDIEKLNLKGKKEAAKRINELTRLSEYTDQ